MSNAFGENLTQRMQALDLTPDQLAGRISDMGLHVQGQTVRRWALGSAQPRADYLPVLTRVLRCHLEDLIPLPRAKAVH